MKPYLWSFFAILSLSIVGCRDDPYGSTESPSNGRSHTQQQTAALQIRVSDSRDAIQKRWRELSEHGTPEKIVDEFALDDLILEAPSLFPHHVDWEGLSLYSDRPFEPTAGVEILRNVRARLQYSPLFNPEQRHSAFICNDEWREKLYLSGADRYGGLNYYSKNRSVFLTGADVESNALLSPQDRPIAAPRTLTYYVAHEFTHSLVFEYLKTNGLPPVEKWLSEGYPDYVALGPDYSYAQAQAAYYDRSSDTHGSMAEDYYRYGMMVTFLIERRGKSIQELLSAPPNREDVARECGLRGF